MAAVNWWVLDGIAVGGPRNGVRLTASEYWNGVVRKVSGERYDGHYKFDAVTCTWEWLPAET